MNMRLLFRGQELFRYINTVLLSCIVVLGGGRVFGILNADGVHAVIVAVLATVVLLLHILQRKKMLLGIFFGLLLGILVIGVMGVRESGEFAQAYFNWLTNRPGWNAEWATGYAVIQILWIVTGCYLFQILMEKAFRIKVLVSAGIVVWLLYCMVTGQNVSTLFAGCGITYCFLLLTEWTQRKWEKVRTQSIFACMNWLLPFLVVYFILLLNMPVSSKPYDWKFIKDAKEEWEDAVLAISLKFFPQSGEPEFVFSGFSEGGRLEESLYEKDRKVMLLRTNGQLKTNIYLVGKIFCSFNGREWIADAKMYPDEMHLDTAQTIYAVKRYDGEFYMDHIAYTFMDVCYRYLHSQNLFTPLKTYDVERNSSNVSVSGKEGSYLLDESPGFGATFDIGFYQMNSGSDFFQNLPQTEPDPELLQTVLDDLKARTGVELKPEDFAAYEEFCYGHYLKDINLSEESEEYLAGILQEADSDIEKLKAIESELRTFEYSGTPGEIPQKVIDGGSFLDYFLLENRKGYCTHFATAFTLLAQSQGLPARYVHGYCVPVNEPGEVDVTSSMAHAWPEVYLKGIGWIPFEPTPGYGEVRYGSWEMKKDSLIAEIEREKYEKRQGLYVEKNMESDNTEEMENKTPVIVYFQKILWGIIRVTALFMVVVGLFAGGEYLKNRWVFTKMSEERKFRYKVEQNLKILSALGFNRADTETFSEYRIRIRKELSDEISLHFIKEYERLLYDDKPADIKIGKELMEEQDILLGVLRERKRVRYLLYRVTGR